MMPTVPDPTLNDFSKRDKEIFAHVVDKTFVERLKYLRFQMYQALIKSERARDTYYATVDAYKAKGLRGIELEQELKLDRVAQNAISDSQLYDRWATKYAAVIQSEAAMQQFTARGHIL